MTDTMTNVNLVAGEEDRAEVVRRELLLLDPAVRADRHRVLALLDPDFVEFGASGRVWGADEVADALAADAAPLRRRATDLFAATLSADTVLLTYRIAGQERPSLRSSIWLRNADGEWLLRFHQGTPAPSATQTQNCWRTMFPYSSMFRVTVRRLVSETMKRMSQTNDHAPQVTSVRIRCSMWFTGLPKRMMALNSP